MAQAESNRVSLKVSKETTWNETPSTPTMLALPYTRESLNHQKRTKQSDVLRSDRMKDAQVQVGVSAEGDINFELRFLDFDTLLEVALASTYATQSTTGAGTSNNFAFAAASGGTQVITGPSNWTTNYLVGAWVRVKSATQSANNGIFKITAKTSTTLTVANTAGVIEANSTAQVNQKCLRNGTTKQSLLIEKQYNDLTNNFINYRGMRVDGLSMSITSEQIITGAFRFKGVRGNLATSTVAGGTTAASSNESMTASTNVGSIVEGGASLSTGIKSITFNLSNNTRALAAVGNVAAIGINMGSLMVTGRAEAYFEDQALLTKVFSHTSSALEFRCTDSGGNVMIYTFSQLRWSGNPDNPGIDQDVMLPLEFSCEREPTNNVMFQIDSLAP